MSRYTWYFLIFTSDQKIRGKLFYMDAEDAEQEMKLAFLIAVHSMSYYNSEGECLSYIRNGLYRRFCALCRGNYQNSEEATEDSKLCEYGFTEKYDDVETLFDYEMLLTNKPIVYSRISGSCWLGIRIRKSGRFCTAQSSM